MPDGEGRPAQLLDWDSVGCPVRVHGTCTATWGGGLCGSTSLVRETQCRGVPLGDVALDLQRCCL